MPRKKAKAKKEDIPVVKKKRGRKPKNPPTETPETPVVKKKRGRKPKGGKLIKKTELKLNVNVKQQQNIILHLKCKKTDVNSTLLMSNGNYNPDVNNLSDPTAYQLNTNSKLQSLNFQNLKISESIKKKPIANIFNKSENQEKKTPETDINIKEIWVKLDKLKNKLRHNNVSDKKSSCFWCTYAFDNPAIHIPIKYENNSYEVYGCFCCPECAVAHLKNENIDASTLWERYSLINNIYSKIYNYTINIKPAPNPYYTLEKYYGNLTIQEYRKLLQNDKLLMIVDKPMTKILPELYEENNEIPNVYSNLLDNTSKTPTKSKEFRLKRKKISHTKNEILSSNFNF
jgi:hypothetical protein